MSVDTKKTLTRIHTISVSIAVKDLGQTAAWYHDNLGFRIVQRREFPEYSTRIAFLEANGVRMELIEDQRWKPVHRPDPPQHTSLQGVSQITFAVEDLDTVIRRVKDRDIVIAWDLVVVEDLNLKEFFIRDNEGNIIQFIEHWD